MSAFDLYNVYDFLWFFAVYAFLGWCSEVAFAAVCDGKFVNRGFLNGPVCPIYGFGVIIVIAVLTPLASNKPVLFVGSVLLTSALEWITGFILEKVFHNKWWDYSDTPFNLNGYICLKFSIIWGFACLFIMEIFHPTVIAFIGIIPPFAGWIIIVVLLIFFTADAVVTAASILKLNKQLEQMEEIAQMLTETSVRLGESISENVLELKEKSEEWREKGEDIKEELQEKGEDIKETLAEQTAKAKAEWEQKQLELQEQMEELRQRYERLADRAEFIHKRMMKAFPGMKSEYHADAFEELKKRYGLK